MLITLPMHFCMMLTLADLSFSVALFELCQACNLQLALVSNMLARKAQPTRTFACFEKGISLFIGKVLKPWAIDDPHVGF